MHVRPRRDLSLKSRHIAFRSVDHQSSVTPISAARHSCGLEHPLSHDLRPRLARCLFHDPRQDRVSPVAIVVPRARIEIERSLSQGIDQLPDVVAKALAGCKPGESVSVRNAGPMSHQLPDHDLVAPGKRREILRDLIVGAKYARLPQPGRRDRRECLGDRRHREASVRSVRHAVLGIRPAVSRRKPHRVAPGHDHRPRPHARVHVRLHEGVDPFGQRRVRLRCHKEGQSHHDPHQTLPSLGVDRVTHP